MKYRVDFFKESGKWYANEEVILPKALVKQADEYNANKDWGKAIYDIRNWVHYTLTKGLQHYKGMHAVVQVPEDDDYMAYPMLITADQRK